MRLAVVGAGAIGGFLAAVLAKAGVPVAVVARGAHLEAIQRPRQFYNAG
jgi:2-dehydropantoate 2-reductase